MSRATTRSCPERPWLATLAMLCQLLAPAFYAPHQAALAYELDRAAGEHSHHPQRGQGQPAGDPASCVVHMALQAAASGAAPAPPPALPVRLATFVATTPAVAAPSAESRTWRPQATRAPPCSSDPMNA